MNIELIDGLGLDANGCLTNANGDAVHLRQGDLDGACGPYCVVMALLALNVLDSCSLPTMSRLDYRTRIGRLFREIERLHDPMVTQGTTIEQLEAMFAIYPNLATRTYADSPSAVLTQVSQALADQHPVIVDVTSRKNDGLRHWTLAIGQCDEFIYLLDPAYELPVASCWNAVLSRRSQSDRYG